MLGHEENRDRDDIDDREHQHRPPGLIAVLNGLVQQQVEGFAVPREVSVPAHIPAPLEGHFVGFVILPGLLIHTCQLLVGLGGKSPRAARLARTAEVRQQLGPEALRAVVGPLTANPSQALFHAGRVISAEATVGETLHVEQAISGPASVGVRPVVFEPARGRVSEIDLLMQLLAGSPEQLPLDVCTAQPDRTVGAAD